MGDDKSSTDIVLAFVSHMVQVRDEILAQVPGAPDDVLELIRAVRGERLHPRFQVESRSHYAVHGTGVRMVSASGIEIDVDVDTEGREIFDAWRVRSFAESAGLGDYALNELASAMDALVGYGTLAVARHGSYRLADPATNGAGCGDG